MARGHVTLPPPVAGVGGVSAPPLSRRRLAAQKRVEDKEAAIELKGLFACFSRLVLGLGEGRGGHVFVPDPFRTMQ